VGGLVLWRSPQACQLRADEQAAETGAAVGARRAGRALSLTACASNLQMPPADLSALPPHSSLSTPLP